MLEIWPVIRERGALIRHRRFAAWLLWAAIVVCRSALADAWDPPAGYYNGATGTGATLKSQLNTIMTTGHIQRTYGNFRDSAAIHDADPNAPGKILLVYNRASVSAMWDSGTTWDREHVWPQSLQGGGDNVGNNDTGPRADPHTLRPCNPSINSSRGNKLFGFETEGGSHHSVNADYYYPGDPDKGDVSRQLFYQDTRWTSGALPLTLTDDAPPPGSHEMGDLSSLVYWNYADPPDEFERRRNHTIYSQAYNPLYYTNNRNAFVDRPEHVWSIYVDQLNDSQITIAGATPDPNGGSTQIVDLGRVFVGGAVPGAQSFTLNKASNDGTYYEVTTSGAATSTLSGRYNAFRMGQPDSKSINVGLNTNTATAGLRSGSVTIDNLDVTTGGCAGTGCGANDGNDTFNVSLTVLDHATPSFANPSLATTLIHDFGTLSTADSPADFSFDVFNLDATPGFTANMDFDSLGSSGDTTVLTTNAAALAGSLSLAAGTGHTFAAMINAVAVGSFSATYTLNFSDENLSGALNNSITLSLTGNVILAGDYNRDEAVDAADYTVWRRFDGQNVAAYSGADGNGDGLVDNEDFDLWKANFGEVAPGTGTGSAAAVPEPAGALLAAIAATVCHCLRRAERRNNRARHCSRPNVA
jgi:endonuclease I